MLSIVSIILKFDFLQDFQALKSLEQLEQFQAFEGLHKEPCQAA